MEPIILFKADMSISLIFLVLAMFFFANAANNFRGCPSKPSKRKIRKLDKKYKQEFAYLIGAKYEYSTNNQSYDNKLNCEVKPEHKAYVSHFIVNVLLEVAQRLDNHKDIEVSATINDVICAKDGHPEIIWSF